MSVLFQTLINSTKLPTLRISLHSTRSSCKCFINRHYSAIPRKLRAFEEVVAERRKEAKQSLVVQVNSASSFNELYGYCSKYADIKGIHHYNNNHTGDHFMLIEFSSEDNLKDVLKTCSTHQRDNEVMPVKSPFLWFRAAQEKKEVFAAPENVSLTTRDGTVAISEEELFRKLMQSSNVSEQIQLMYDETVLNDLGVRLRYIVARQLEMILGSLYSNIAVLPFGSSVNGFGRMGCDLDLVLTDELTADDFSDHKRLVFSEKAVGSGGSRRQLELAAEVLELRVAGAARVTRILHARVPILKCRHELAQLDLDLSTGSTSGVSAAALLWQLGALAAARPLAMCVRRWAACRLGAPAPSRGLTNYPLTLLVLFYLQRSGLLPPTGHADKVISNYKGNQVQNLDKSPPNLETLLLEFFEFYAQFDFDKKAISVIEGVPVRKPTSQPLYIVNPLEPALNVTRNVGYEECERFKLEVRNAAWLLEASAEEKSENWGILGLIEQKSSHNLKKLLHDTPQRLVSVKDLFNDEEDQVDDLKSRLERASSAAKIQNRPEKFKNSSIASAVKRFRREKWT